MRRYGPDPVPVPAEGLTRWTDRKGAYGLVVDHRGAIVVRTADPGHELILPGGGVDPGESPLRALHREIREETGWTVRPVRRLGAYLRFVRRRTDGTWLRKVCHVYLCRPALRLGPPSEPGHSPTRMRLADAAVLLSLEGERAFAARLEDELRAAPSRG